MQTDSRSDRHIGKKNKMENEIAKEEKNSEKESKEEGNIHRATKMTERKEEKISFIF